jgi:hypothetical protein
MLCFTVYGGTKDGEKWSHTSLEILAKCAHRSAEQGPLLGMRPRRCAQTRVCPSAKASRYRVASARLLARDLLRRTRAHVAAVCATSEAVSQLFVHSNTRSIIQRKRREQ